MHRMQAFLSRQVQSEAVIMIDETEPARRARFLEIQEESLKARSEFEQKYGQVWDTKELSLIHI